jgi:hypothetical protein
MDGETYNGRDLNFLNGCVVSVATVELLKTHSSL